MRRVGRFHRRVHAVVADGRVIVSMFTFGKLRWITSHPERWNR